MLLILCAHAQDLLKVKARKKSGTGPASRKLSFILVTSACFVLVLLVFFFLSGKFVFLENMFQFPDIDILDIFRLWQK